ncbi:MAG: phage portal protein [Brevibacterium aurantiacum]|nr:phage portal protein [Brevibacterium aurantiacum]
MPLPTIGTAWPPEDQRPIFQRLNEWQAWWSGDPDALRKAYAGGTQRPSLAARGGVAGAVKRFFWGEPGNSRQGSTKLHVPLAADICQASGDLLFAEPVKATVDNDKAQERLDLILADGAHSTFTTAAEIGAALGGTFLRVVWDETVTDHPFIDSVDADYAAPEFKWSRLQAVTFYFIVETRGQVVFRHAERHELDANGQGVVYHGLYEGTASELGRLAPLTDHRATEGIVVDAEGKVDTGTPGLAAVYIPNVLPNRSWRKHPVGRNLGRSDLDQLEPLLDALDEVYASWMRDIRLGKARILAGRTALEDNGLGQGATFDLDREVYEGLNVAPGAAKDDALAISQVQFAIRYEEHLETAKELTRLILRTAGYSAATFGDTGDGGGAVTASEVHSRDRRTMLTRGRKERHFRTGLERLLAKLLDIDRIVFNGPGAPGPVTVEFPDGAQDSSLETAQTVQALYTAQSASTQVRVQMMHPDWDQADIDEEVARIMSEFSLSDPDTIGSDGFNLSGQFGQGDEEPSFPTDSIES